MVGFDSGLTLADRFRVHAGDRQHLYGHAMRAMASDWEAGGPVREVCAGYEDAPAGAVIQLRLLAGIFRLVLTGRAERLRPFYPCLGGTAAPADVWPVMRTVIAEHAAELHDDLRIAPQTNEVGRSAALLVGLFDLVERSGFSRIRLWELGASAGLNLLLDRFHLTAGDWAYGVPDSPLQLVDAVQGPVRPQSFVITERRGCDLHPIDPGAPDGQLLLTSFVWPFDLHRHERLRGALEVVDADGAVAVEPAGAGDWLESELPRIDPGPEILTVVWRSITQQYWPSEEVDRVASLLDAYGRQRPLGTVSMEYARGSPPDARPLVTTQLWAGDDTPPVERFVATAHDHGVPVEMVAADRVSGSAPAEPD